MTENSAILARLKMGPSGARGSIAVTRWPAQSRTRASSAEDFFTRSS